MQLIKNVIYEIEVSHKDEYDHIIINNEIDNCVKEIQSHILNRRNILKYD